MFKTSAEIKFMWFNRCECDNYAVQLVYRYVRYKVERSVWKKDNLLFYNLVEKRRRNIKVIRTPIRDTFNWAEKLPAQCYVRVWNQADREFATPFYLPSSWSKQCRSHERQQWLTARALVTVVSTTLGGSDERRFGLVVHCRRASDVTAGAPGREVSC